MSLKRHVDIGSLEYLSKKLRLAKSILGNHLLGYEIGEASEMLHEAAQARPEKDITRPWGPTKEDLITFSKQRIGSTLKYLNGKGKDVQSCRKILIEVVKDLSNKSYTDSSCTDFKGAAMNLKRYIDVVVKREIKNAFKDEIISEESIETASKWAGIAAELSNKIREHFVEVYGQVPYNKKLNDVLYSADIASVKLYHAKWSGKQSTSTDVNFAHDINQAKNRLNYVVKNAPLVITKDNEANKMISKMRDYALIALKHIR